MNTRTMLMLGISAVVLGGAVAGYAGQSGIAFAGTQDAAKIAARQFDLARRNLIAGKAEAAVAQAEAAVGYAPETVAYRVLLGQAYLKAGRFGSAHSAFADALVLDPINGKAALNLALAEIAEGNWDGARRTLDANASTIAVSDRGLAIALAGDPAAAVELLDSAARAPDADAKTRQNYALALALAGRWQDARTVAAMDVSPDQIDARMVQWASFAKPMSASDQVASLLGVTPVQDPGQPVRLALATRGDVGLAAVKPVDAYMPGVPASSVTIAVPVATPAPVSSEAPMPVVASVSNVSFGARQEVVQALPPRAVRVAAAKRDAAPGAAVPVIKIVFEKPKPVMGAAVAHKAVPVMPARAPAKGDFFVQLGAFENAAVAKDAWARMTRRNAGFASHSPSGMAVSTKAGNFYRLSVGGFARGDADALCRGYRAKGGKCFVRAGAGDTAVAWVKPGVKLASR